MMIVFAVGTSMPLSMIVVQSSRLAVPDRDPGLRHEFGEPLRRRLDGVDAVVHEVDLAAATQLAQAGLADHRPVPLGHEGLDGQACGRWRGDQRQVAQSAECHVEGARDRRCGQGQHVHFGAQRPQPFLVADAEAMLLVDDQQPEILEPDARLQQPVGADDEVDLAGREACERGLGLRVAPES
jgi:hypothetical protein